MHLHGSKTAHNKKKQVRAGMTAACIAAITIAGTTMNAMADVQPPKLPFDEKAVAKTGTIPLIYSGAGTDTTLLGILPPNCVIEKGGSLGKWSRIRLNDFIGWVKTNLLMPADGQSDSEDPSQTDCMAVVNAEGLYMRAAASTDSEVIGMVKNGDTLIVKEASGGWYETNVKGTKAYLSKEFMTPVQSETPIAMQDYEASYGVFQPESTWKKSELESPNTELQPAPEIYEGDPVIPDQPVWDVYTADQIYYEPVYTDIAQGVPAEYVEPYYEAPEAAEAPIYEPLNTSVLYPQEELNAEAYTEYIVEEPVYEFSEEEAYASPEQEYIETETTDTAYSDLPAEQAQAEVSQEDLDLLAAIIQCEAGGESREGKVAVGACVLNRMNSSMFPDTISDVIYQSGQFTPAMTGNLDATLSEGAREDCYEAAQAALNGENPIGDLLYFHAGGGDGLTIGNQTFY